MVLTSYLICLPFCLCIVASTVLLNRNEVLIALKDSHAHRTMPKPWQLGFQALQGSVYLLSPTTLLPDLPAYPAISITYLSRLVGVPSLQLHPLNPALPPASTHQPKDFHTLPHPGQGKSSL